MKHPFRYENRDDKPLSRCQFFIRLCRTFVVALLLIGGALMAGMLGYRWLEGMSWTDSFLNASMILGGMGPVDPMKTECGKIFAGCYALFSGLAFLALAGIIFSPIAHRLLHRFHYDADQDEK